MRNEGVLMGLEQERFLRCCFCLVLIFFILFSDMDF